ncbi:PREDICTED: furin-like protease 2 isoform X1 [Acromyrmex echinatior]|uniref:furin-like protease 2 isoform X1 n=1 Tax=Acromyrmex echinatior TaxID=103372 RepID=UPI000580F6A0|nr:PREDICTED: furin-like protease 2 isoform X1 [Acromyrmex echinatior]
MIFRVTLLIVCTLLAGARSEPRPRSRPVSIYSNQFAVYVPSGSETADEIAQEHGFDNHGQVCYSSTAINIHCIFVSKHVARIAFISLYVMG